MSQKRSQRRTLPNRRSLLLGAAGLTVVLIATLPFALSGRSAAADDSTSAAFEMPPMPVDAAEARQETVSDEVRGTGRIEAIHAIELRPDEPGRVVRLHFREGQTVSAGASLVQVDDAMLRAHAERARADRDLARQQLERVRRMRAENAATPADLERAEATSRSAEASVTLIELQVARTTVRAPFSGVVGRRLVSLGDYVTASTPLLTLHTVDPQQAVIEVPERYARTLRRGQPLEFTIAAQPERVFTAEVEFIDPAVDEANRTILVKARAPNRDDVLRPGMFIEARLATGVREGSVVIPEDAVQPLRTGFVVWAIVEGKASRRTVQLGVRTRGMVEVLSGVEAGELVVVGGLERMAEGMAVMPRQTEPGATGEPGPP